MTEFAILATFVVGILFGALALQWLGRGKHAAELEAARSEGQLQASTYMERAQHLQLELDSARNELANLQQQLAHYQQQATSNAGIVAELKAKLQAESHLLARLQSAEEQLSNRFKALANEILEDKSKRFAEQNQTNLQQLLDPLRQRITEFQGQVQDVYIKEGQQRTALSEQVKQLLSLNQQLSGDAHELTRALKGQVKTQGNWGEMILERVLEVSGLRRGHEYRVQESHSLDGRKLQPDVVIKLPQNRHLVIDAKVSLLAWDEYVNSDDPMVRDLAQRKLVESLRAHIKGLSERNYQSLYGLQSLDCVLLFIPLEPAYMLALEHNALLWQEAWSKNILLVGPTTLLFAVRTVAQLWRQEQQTQNAQEIAKRGADLYDKLHGMVDDFDKLGERLRQAQSSFDDTYNKLAKGRGNLVVQAERLKALGVTPNKSLSSELVERASEGALELEVKPASPAA